MLMYKRANKMVAVEPLGNASQTSAVSFAAELAVLCKTDHQSKLAAMHGWIAKGANAHAPAHTHCR